MSMRLIVMTCLAGDPNDIENMGQITGKLNCRTTEQLPLDDANGIEPEQSLGVGAVSDSLARVTFTISP